jgi:hypothetical protein
MRLARVATEVASDGDRIDVYPQQAEQLIYCRIKHR